MAEPLHRYPNDPPNANPTKFGLFQGRSTVIDSHAHIPRSASFLKQILVGPHVL
jgi:hypothetical protein